MIDLTMSPETHTKLAQIVKSFHIISIISYSYKQRHHRDPGTILEQDFQKEGVIMF